MVLPMNDVFILDAVRTPIGRYGGALAGVRPDDLVARVVGSVINRAPNLEPAHVAVGRGLAVVLAGCRHDQ